MLALGRKPEESIEISKDDVVITVKVLRCQSHKCVLGVDAPKDWKVLRDELVDKERTEP